MMDQLGPDGSSGVVSTGSATTFVVMVFVVVVAGMAVAVMAVVVVLAVVLVVAVTGAGIGGVGVGGEGVAQAKIAKTGSTRGVLRNVTSTFYAIFAIHGSSAGRPRELASNVLDLLHGQWIDSPSTDIANSVGRWLPTVFFVVG